MTGAHISTGLLRSSANPFSGYSFSQFSQLYLTPERKPPVLSRPPQAGVKGSRVSLPLPPPQLSDGGRIASKAKVPSQRRDAPRRRGMHLSRRRSAVRDTRRAKQAFRAFLGSASRSLTQAESPPSFAASQEVLPEVDWVAAGKVTPVRSQVRCGELKSWPHRCLDP